MTPAKLKDVAAFVSRPARFFWQNSEGEWIRFPPTVSNDAELIVALLEEFARRKLYPTLRWLGTYWEVTVNNACGTEASILEALLAAVPEGE